MVVLVVAAVLAINSIATRTQEQRFLELVAANPSIQPPATLDEDALIDVFHTECGFVKEGWTAEV